MKRANTRKRRTKFLGTWVSDALLALLDEAVEAGDTDRSKLIRHALKEKVAKTLQPAVEKEKFPRSSTPKPHD
jgi:metal-responsive CopG/Arc/MetJ family transcriptional regulator